MTGVVVGCGSQHQLSSHPLRGTAALYPVREPGIQHVAEGALTGTLLARVRVVVDEASRRLHFTAVAHHGTFYGEARLNRLSFGAAAKTEWLGGITGGTGKYAHIRASKLLFQVSRQGGVFIVSVTGTVAY